MAWPWNPGYASFKVIKNGTIQSLSAVFLFALYSKWPPSCTISEIKRYIGRRSRFSYPCIRRPIHGEKSLMICLAVSKKTGVCQTDGQTSFCSIVRELCTASRGKNSISLRSTMTKDWRYTNVSYKHCYNTIRPTFEPFYGLLILIRFSLRIYLCSAEDYAGSPSVLFARRFYFGSLKARL